jgi:hyperosmotically inducible protein
MKGLAMISKIAARCIFAGAILAPIVAHSDDQETDRAHPQAFVKDSVITTKVKAKLAAEKVSTLARIKVDTDNKGEVFLSGKVRSEDEADRAIAIARNTEGVASVTSHLKIRKDD